jgi:hypothetical protein
MQSASWPWLNSSSPGCSRSWPARRRVAIQPAALSPLAGGLCTTAAARAWPPPPAPTYDLGQQPRRLVPEAAEEALCSANSCFKWGCCTSSGIRQHASRCAGQPTFSAHRYEASASSSAPLLSWGLPAAHMHRGLGLSAPASALDVRSGRTRSSLSWGRPTSCKAHRAHRGAGRRSRCRIPYQWLPSCSRACQSGSPPAPRGAGTLRHAGGVEQPREQKWAVAHGVITSLSCLYALMLFARIGGTTRRVNLACGQTARAAGRNKRRHIRPPGGAGMSATRAAA